MAGLTREELIAKGAKPVSHVPAKQGFTLAELQAKKAATTPQESVKEKSSLMGNIGNTLAGVVRGVSAPGRTIQNLLPEGLVGRSTKQGFEQATGSNLESTPAKIGNFVGEASTYVAPGGIATKATKGLGLGVKMLATGGTDAAVQSLNQGEVDKKTLATGLVSGGTTGIIGATGKLLAKSGEAIMNSVLKPSRVDVTDGFSIETVKKYDLGGPLHVVQEKTENMMNRITQELNEKLAATDTKIDLAEVYKKTAARLTSDRLKTFGTNTGVGGALNGLKTEIDTVGNQVSVPDAQLVKRAAGQYGAWTYNRPDADTAKQAVYNVFYNELKKNIEDASPAGVRELNKQLSELIPVQNAVIRRIPVAERNMPISLTEIIGLSSAAINPAGLGVFALSRAQKSGAFGNFLQKAGSSINNKAVPTGVGAGGLTGLLTNQSDNQ